MHSFVHVRKTSKKGTIALEPTNKKDLTSLFEQHGTATLMPIGVARLSPKDNFDRTIGREYAEQRISWKKCDLMDVEVRGTKHIYHFKSEVDNYCPNEEKTQSIYFGLSTTRESDKVQIVYGHFGE